MNPSARHASLALEGVIRPLAEWTVSSLHGARLDLPQRYGAAWREDWLALIRSQLSYLAQAVAVEYPPVFVDAVAWGIRAFGARDVPIEDVDVALRCLRDVLCAELPEAVAGHALPAVDAALSAPAAAPGPLDAPHYDADTPTGQLVTRYLADVLEGRTDDAIATVINAARAGMAVGKLYELVLQPAQHEIGHMWHRGDISIADEHCATLTTQTCMALLRPYFPQVEAVGRSVVSVGVGGEAHEIGVRMVADAFTMAGWQAHCLGTNIPSVDIIEAVVRHRAHLMAVSATTTLTLRAVADLIDGVRATPECAHVAILVGGGAVVRFSGLWQVLGADGSADSMSAAVEVGTRLTV